MRLSIVIPTKNEADNITACLGAFRARLDRHEIEAIVVDNASGDATRELARAGGARVVEQGPERCAQRNRGWREAQGDYVMFVDADMIVPEETQDEILAILSGAEPPDALYVRETRTGASLRIKARNFERSFYNATAIDGLRVIRREWLEAIGGYDERLVACEDWDLDRRLLAAGATTALTEHALLHNERRVTFAKHLKKKRYYAETMDLYRRKWNNDAIVHRQFSPFYRLVGIFFEHGNWRRTLRHPFLYALVLLDRIAVGLTYLFNRRTETCHNRSDIRKLLDRLHAKLGDLWWYSLMIFIACRSGDVIQAFIGLWLVPKYVGTEELGAVLPLQQLSGLFAVPLAILATVFAKYVNTYATRGEYGKVKSFIRDVLLTACGVFLVCIAGAYFIIPHFYERLNIQAGMLTVLILSAGFASNIASIFTAALQGLKKFKTMTVQNLISAPIRLVTLLVAMPFRALSGYILGQATPPASCSLLAAGSLYKDLNAIPMDTSWRKDLPEICRYLWPVAIYTGIGTVTGAIFITVIRQRLPEVESAAFYILSRLAEIAGYAAGSMAVVLFPLASEAHEKGENTTGILRRTAMLSIAATLVLSGIFTLIAPVIFAHVSAWSQYGEYAYLLPPMTIFAGFAALIGAFVAYEVACRHFITLALIYGLNVIITALLVSFTGGEFFRGILPDATVDWMTSLSIARLQTIVYLFTAWNVIQIPIFSLSDRLFYSKAITHRQ